MIMINNNNENGNNNCGSDNNTNNTENNGTSNNMIKTIKKIWKVKDKSKKIFCLIPYIQSPTRNFLCTQEWWP